MKKSIKSVVTYTSVAVAGLAISAASGFARPGKDGQRRRPPQEAIDACSNSNSGDTCEFEHRGNKVTGVCRNPPPKGERPQPRATSETEERPLACVPARRGPPRDEESQSVGTR